MNRAPTFFFVSLMAAGCLSLAGCGNPMDRLTAEEAITEGNDHLRQGDYGEAVQFFSAALEKEPENVTARNNRAVALIALERFELAYEDITRAIRYGKDQRADSYIIRATLHRLLKQNDWALADVNRAIQIDGQNPEAYRARARIYDAQNRPAQARRDLQTADRLAAHRSR